MRTHGADRVAKGGAVLDEHTLDGIGVVAAPDLRGVVQHTGVKPAAAAGASLEQHMGEGGGDPLQQIIHAQHKAVVDFTLTAGRQPLTPHIGKMPVHIPLHIFDIGAREDIAHALEQVIAHVLPGHIQHKLVPAAHARTVLRAQAPFGMGAVQITVFTDHLRLKPDAEFHAQAVDAVHQFFQAAVDFILVDKPVAQTGGVALALAKPAVVHYQHLNADLRGVLGDLVQLLLVKIEVGALPVVDQHRAVLQLVLAAAHIVADHGMLALAENGQPLSAVHH